MKLTPIGAAGGVTGSCTLVETAKTRVIVDCGVYQGRDETPGRNAGFPFNPASIDAVLLTHAHLDHCGRLPYLGLKGFRGPIYSTAATMDLTQFILMDSARLLRDDYERHLRKNRRAGIETEEMLYDEQDVLQLMPSFRPQAYGKTFTVGDLQVTLRQSGHILGSATIEVRGDGKSVVFTGDLGEAHRNVVPDPAPAPVCDAVVCESTYGDRSHKGGEESVAELRDAINWAYQQGGNVIIPSFAMERTQDILYLLRELRERGDVPQNPVYLDSPLAINITKVYERHLDDLDDETRAVVTARRDPFNFPGLTQTVTTMESRALNGLGGSIIIAGSGMCTGGRVVHHLKHNLWRSDSAVIFVGYQAGGTLGRVLLDGVTPVNIDHESVIVRARIFTINGFSAHADQPGLLSWLSTSAPARILLNHGETKASATLADLLAAQGRTVDVVEAGKTYEV
jgi:metallo-beta-lactamase family protein